MFYLGDVLFVRLLGKKIGYDEQMGFPRQKTSFD
jgi:hypothetical protein